jgi:hypothetical protein
MKRRERITLSFVLETDDETYYEMAPLNNVFQAVCQALYPGVNGTIEGGGRLRIDTLRSRERLSGTHRAAKRTAEKAR